MRKLKLQMQLSVDGFVAGPNGEMDFMVWNWDDALRNYVSNITNPVDCIIMGRNLAQGFIPYWAKVAENPEDPQFVFGKKMNDTPKVVFSKTLEKSEWNNTDLAKGAIPEEVKQLKKREGGDIIAYGGANFVSSLISNNLIDDYYLFVNPAAIGKGMAIFRDRSNLKLVASKGFDCGIVLLHYEPQK